ncbi:MAG: AAA family ATPase [Lachnospira sp.]|nr:AAA family ATPase [Lachnospira sp.]
MQIEYLLIKNFKSIKELEIKGIEDVLILVGRNNAGKSVVLDAIRAVTGDYEVTPRDFNNNEGNISIKVRIIIDERDLNIFFQKGLVSSFKHFDLWYKDFQSKLPSYRDGRLDLEYVYSRDGRVKYRDGFKKNNSYIKSVLPKIFYVDHERRKSSIQEDLIMLQGGTEYADLKDDICIFDRHRKCNQCFNCIGIINRKKPEQLSLLETARLMQYKLFNFNLAGFESRLNEYFARNGGGGERIHYQITFDAEKLMHVDTIVYNETRDTQGGISDLSDGLNSIYILSLLETYAEYGSTVPYIILIEDPEIYLHPQLQKVASEILYKLSRKNQVIFCTHSPQMLFNFTTKQIRQVINNRDNNTVVAPEADIDDILDDLGYAANDLMNVSFVFIVEGKQDRSRLPLLLEKYYSEVIDDSGNLNRIAIVATNSCTNIKTYANLKYINTLYLKDQFLMIRDGDGKDSRKLRAQLTNYYRERAKQDYGNLPRVTDRNVLILKYYSFENYFLDPEVMTKIGVVKSVDEFYDILYLKYKEYLYKLSSTRKMIEKLGITIESRQDIIDNMENIRIYVRGHNLYDIFYGRYKGDKENAILKAYIDAAPKGNFEDIFTAIDRFVYFNNRKNS